MPEIESFSHHGAHYENDERQAAITLLLLGFFATFAVLLIVLGVRAA